MDELTWMSQGETHDPRDAPSMLMRVCVRVQQTHKERKNVQPSQTSREKGTIISVFVCSFSFHEGVYVKPCKSKVLMVFW